MESQFVKMYPPASEIPVDLLKHNILRKLKKETNRQVIWTFGHAIFVLCLSILCIRYLMCNVRMSETVARLIFKTHTWLLSPSMDDIARLRLNY